MKRKLRASVKEGRRRVKSRRTALARIRRNKREYEAWTAKTWLEENELYVRSAVNKLLTHYKFLRFKKDRYSLHSYAFIVAMQRFPKYKVGLRGVTSWLYQQVQFYIRVYIRTNLGKYRDLVAPYPDMNQFAVSKAPSPEELYELKEELASTRN